MPFKKSTITNFGKGQDVEGFEYRHQMSETAGESPASGELTTGEIGVNAADGVLYVGKSDGTAGVIPSSVGITRIVSLTQAEYDAISVKSGTTLYIIT